MNSQGNSVENLIGDASEVVVGNRDEIICESYIFEPAPEEQVLGHLYIVGEIKNMDGAGAELLDILTQALQREYYRDPKRNVLTGFESALHQANLVLHDTTERGWRDWMNHFHVAVLALAGKWVHISATGGACIYMIRSGQIVEISKDLADPKVTPPPLRTFGQVASGQIGARDVLYLGTTGLASAYRPQDLIRFAEERSSVAISTKMRQLYEDQEKVSPASMVVVEVTPRYGTQAKMTATQDQAMDPPVQRQRGTAAPLQPRHPLKITQPIWQIVAVLMVRAIVIGWQWLTVSAWPQARKGLRSGGGIFAKTIIFLRAKLNTARKSRQHTEQATQLPTLSKRFNWKAGVQWPIRFLLLGLARIYSLPTTSKVLAIVAVVLAAALVGSIGLLKDKKTEDKTIQRASELLYQAKTQHEAAETALIYDNREQANKLLDEANNSLKEVRSLGSYEAETVELAAKISNVQDRLQKVTRANSLETKVVGDFAPLIGNDKLTSFEFVEGAAYTFKPKDNTIMRLSEGNAPDVVSGSTSGIGYIQSSATQVADKTIIYLTDAPGVAILDSKDSKFTNQTISFPSSSPSVKAMAAYGNRLYVYDAAVKNIFSYSKTLSGYSSGTAWIEDPDFPRQDIVSMSIDGSIYTLHANGSVRELFKGKQQELMLEKVTPSLEGATKIITHEELNYLYIFDPQHKRIVVFTKKGQLKQQFFMDSLPEVQDIAIALDGVTAYLLSGSQILQVSLQTVTSSSQPNLGQ